MLNGVIDSGAREIMRPCSRRMAMLTAPAWRLCGSRCSGSPVVSDREWPPWRRPPSKRLCELVLLRPGRRVGRERPLKRFFPGSSRPPGRRALSQALSYAREALSALGDAGAALLQSDRALIWANPEIDLEVDLQVVQGRLRDALAAEPGLERDDRLLEALADRSVLLEDEPFAEWVLGEGRFERARQDARSGDGARPL